MEAQSRPYAVALSPTGAVEHHGGQQKQGGKGQQRGKRIPGKGFSQPQPAPGQENVKENGEKLDAIEVGDGQVGQKGQHIEIRDIVIADRILQSGYAAVDAEMFHPPGEKILIVQGGVIQEQNPEKKGQANGQ